MLKITDEKVLTELVSAAISENGKAVADYKNGKKNAMKKSHGAADPIIAEKLIIKSADETVL